MLSYHIPKFLIQPLVENAIIHGVEPKIDSGTVAIIGELGESTVTITVKDNGVGMDSARLNSVVSEMSKEEGGQISQIGLANVYHRIQLYYGDGGGLSIESKLDVGTTVTITIPKTAVYPERYEAPY